MSQSVAGVCYWCGKIISGEGDKKVTTFIRIFHFRRKIYFFTREYGGVFLKVMVIKK